MSLFRRFPLDCLYSSAVRVFRCCCAVTALLLFEIVSRAICEFKIFFRFFPLSRLQVTAVLPGEPCVDRNSGKQGGRPEIWD